MIPKFVPSPVLLCPLCGQLTYEWTSHHVRGLSVFRRQGTEQVEVRGESQNGEDASGKATVRLRGAGPKRERLLLFGSCEGRHSLIADCELTGGAWVKTRLRGILDGQMLPLADDYALWLGPKGEVSLAPRSYHEPGAGIPPSITQVGAASGCLVAKRRPHRRATEDEHWVVFTKSRDVRGPFDEEGLRVALEAESLQLPDDMFQPEVLFRR